MPALCHDRDLQRPITGPTYASPTTSPFVPDLATLATGLRLNMHRASATLQSSHSAHTPHRQQATGHTPPMHIMYLSVCSALVAAWCCLLQGALPPHL